MNIKTNRIPLSSIELMEEPLSPIKTNLKILKRRMPEDFFTVRPAFYSSTSIVREAVRQGPTTSSFTRKQQFKQQPIRDVLTARESNNDEDLILGVLKSAREIKRVFRKHSVELRKQRLPKGKVNQLELMLPPLFLRKGITTPF